MTKNDKMCATCKFCEAERSKNGELPRTGYCYGMPPMFPAKFRPQVDLKHISCSLYETKYD